MTMTLVSADLSITVYPAGDLGTPCDWCDEPARVRVVDRGHREYACLPHADEWLPAPVAADPAPYSVVFNRAARVFEVWEDGELVSSTQAADVLGAEKLEGVA